MVGGGYRVVNRIVINKFSRGSEKIMLVNGDLSRKIGLGRRQMMKIIVQMGIFLEKPDKRTSKMIG